MTREETIKNLDALYPLTCKMVNGIYKGGFRDMESPVGQTISMAVRSLEAWGKVEDEICILIDNLIGTRNITGKAMLSAYEDCLKIIEKHLQEVEKWQK